MADDKTISVGVLDYTERRAVLSAIRGYYDCWSCSECKELKGVIVDEKTASARKCPRENCKGRLTQPNKSVANLRHINLLEKALDLEGVRDYEAALGAQFSQLDYEWLEKLKPDSAKARTDQGWIDAEGRLLALRPAKQPRPRLTPAMRRGADEIAKRYPDEIKIKADTHAFVVCAFQWNADLWDFDSAEYVVSTMAKFGI
jgi:hypothetical protein